MNKEILNNYDYSLLEIVQTISPLNFLLNTIVITIICYCLGLIYVRFGKSLSNRSALADSFTLLGLSTMVVITVVKSSLALSLGLVGALSIVRFRTPVKEPEELIYLFLCIVFGLAVGANQRLIAVLTLLFVIIINIILRRSFLKVTSKEGTFTVFLSCKTSLSQELIFDIFKDYCESVILRRTTFNSSTDETEICLLVRISSSSKINFIIKEINKVSQDIKLDFVDNSKLINSN